MFSDGIIDIINSFPDTAAEIALFIAVAKLYCFMLAGRSSLRNGCTTEYACFQIDINFNGRISAGIKYFPGMDICY
jgi:hypothetical protein